MDFKSFFSNKRNLAVLAFAALVLVIGSLLSKGILMISLFFLLVAISAVISYFQAILRFPIDLSPTFFFTVVIAVKYNLLCTVIFVPIASLLPAMLAGGEINIDSFIFMASFVVVAFLSSFLAGYPILAVGVGAALANLAVGWFINTLKGNRAEFFFSVVNAAISIIYFSAFGPLLIRILS